MHAIKAPGKRIYEYVSADSYLVGLSGRLHAAAALTPGKELPLGIEKDAKKAQDPVWTL